MQKLGHVLARLNLLVLAKVEVQKPEKKKK